MKLEDEVIEGNWRNGRLHGKGFRKMADGELFTCENWINGKMNGYGEHHSKETIYKGHFRNNKEHGKGRKIVN